MSGAIKLQILDSSGKIILQPESHVVGIDIIKEVNKIPVAKLIISDSENPKKFQLSNKASFEPGKKIEIKLGYEDKSATVFEGIVVRHRIKATKHYKFLTIELKHSAIKLTTARKSAVFKNIEDGNLIKNLISGAGVQTGNVDKTSYKHEEIVQYYCTDWDFLMSRADANGLWVLADNGKISVIAPNLSGSAKHSIEFGISEIYEMELEVDIRRQYADVKSQAWNVKEQKLSAPAKAEAFSLKQGNLQPDKMAKTIGAKSCQLRHPVNISPEETKAWANAQMTKSRLSMFKGRLRLPGNANINPGDIIEFKKTSDRFDGKTLVTSVRHQVSAKGWQTDVQFGLSADWFSQQNDNIIDPPAAGLLPAVHGLQIGVVDKFEKDPDGHFRVRVKVPAIDETEGVIWARLTSIDAGKKRGLFFRPEPDDEVVLGFLNDDPRQAVILGTLHSEKNELPEGFEITQENPKKGIVTREALKILFDDGTKGEKKGSIEISTTNKNILQFSDKDKKITLQDQHGNTITMDENGISIKTPKEIVIEGKNLTFKGSSDVALEGGNIKIKGSKVDVN